MHQWPGSVGYLAGAVPDQMAKPNGERRTQSGAKNRTLVERRLGCGARLNLSHTIFIDFTLFIENINDPLAQISDRRNPAKS